MIIYYQIGGEKMLTLENKKSIFHSFEELIEKPISNNRFNYEYPESLQRGKILATQLHPSGNGYVIGKYMDQKTVESKGYKVDTRGWINIKEFSENELHEVIEIAMMSMNMSLSKPKTRKGVVTLVTTEEQTQKSVSQPIPENLVCSCFYHLLDFGKFHAYVWFIGIEEREVEIWRSYTKTLEESFNLCSQVQKEICYVWADMYRNSLEFFKGANVWQ